MRTLSIEVPPDLMAKWVRWFAPDVQPFLVKEALAVAVAEEPQRKPLPDELRDTFQIYVIPEGLSCIWLSEPDFMGLPRSTRVALVRAQRTAERELVPSVRSWPALVDKVRGQADGHRFVWWPSLLAGREERVLENYIEDGRRPSRHDEVPERTWASTEPVLPGARALAGTFPAGSGPNCFATVMAAAGVAGAESVWMQREPFETWLSETTRAGGRDGDPGTVLVWRSADGLVQHAAITIGDGWALHKPSQGWMSPTKVLKVADAKRSARDTGRHLQRYSLEA